MKVLIATEKPFNAKAVEAIKKELESQNHCVKLLEKYTSTDELKEAVKDAEAMIVRSDKITKEILDAAPKLKVVVRAGAGYDSIDTAYAKEKGVVVENTPGQNSNAVAELVFGLLIYMCRSCFSGKSGCELKGKKLGILAFGNIGRHVARIANGFGMEVYGFSRSHAENPKKEDGVQFVATKEELFKQCDIVSVHLPSNEHTKQSVGYDVVNLMKKGGILVNTARKEVINEPELLRLMGEREDLKFVTDIKPDADAEFAKFEGRYFTTPKKMGAQTAEANANAGIAAAQQINAYFKDGCTKFQVNK